MIRWKKDAGEIEAWIAFSGQLQIGYVLYRTVEPRCWVYSVDAIRTNFIAKWRGEVRSAGVAKRAVERISTKWCEHAGLRAV